jgi:phospholipid/cholesterol/gamma-HCH transport system substrate-binding protein
MESKVSFAIVGAFVLLLGAALVGGTLWLSSGKAYRHSYETYVVYMADSVAGLSPDAIVTYRGVQVGRVRKIELAPNNGELVRLTLDIEKGTPIKQDTVATLHTQGLTGIAHVELSGGSPSSPPLTAKPGEEFPVIPSGPSLFTRLDTAVTELLDNLNKSSTSLNAVLDADNRRAFAQTLANLEAVTHTFAQRSRSIDATLSSTARAMENVAKLSDQLSGLVERVQASADRFDSMSARVSQASSDVVDTVRGAGADVHRFTGETLPETRALIGELRGLSASLRRFSDELETNPALLVQGRPPAKPGPGE